MPEFGNENELQLDESSGVIRMYLNLTHHGKFDFGLNANCEKFSNLIHFLKKYDCPVAMKLLISLLQADRGDQHPPFLLFSLGVECCDPRLCADALNMPACSWKDYISSTTWVGLKDIEKDVDMLHPTALPRQFFMSMPPAYLWALTHIPFDKAVKSGPNSLGARFLRLLAKAGVTPME